MTEDQKKLLIKDLCGRLPYGVKFNFKYAESSSEIMRAIYLQDYMIISSKDYSCEINDIKPYLFPLSSMTEEQWMDSPYANLNKFTFDSFKCGCSTLVFETYEVNLNYVVEFINWCYKNHFDINGFIPMGLAIDCTNLNIY